MCLDFIGQILLATNFNRQVMIIGITGHQEIGSTEVVAWVRETLQSAIDRLDITKGISCLAIGSDQMFAEVILSKGVELIAVIPCLNYEFTFHSSDDLLNYQRLKLKAAELIQMDEISPTEQAFYQASQYLVDRSNAIIAIWNGQPAKGFGGTADVVSYASNKGKNIIHINPVLKTIKYK
jgi:hypothetical protein